MAAVAIEAVAEYLGRFSDDLTALVDHAFGTDWAENNEILALVEIARSGGVTTRRIAEVSGMSRRAISRLVTHLSADGIVIAAPSAADRRAVAITLTRYGRSQTDQLCRELEELFRSSRGTAEQIVAGLGGTPELIRIGTAEDPLEFLHRIAAEGALLGEVIGELTGPTRLSGRQRTALVQISAHDGMRPAQLSPSLGVTRAGVSYVIDQLCALGLVHRRLGAVPEDKRAVVLETTPAGEQRALLLTAAIARRREGLVALFAQIASRSSTGPRS